MTLTSNKCSKMNYGERPLWRKKEFRSSIMKIVDSSLDSSLQPTDTICSFPCTEDGFHLKKRRKMDEEYNSLLTKGKARQSTTRSFTTSGCNSSLVQKSDGKSLTVSSNVEVPNSGAKAAVYKRDNEEDAEAPAGTLLTNSRGAHSNVDNGKLSSTSSHRINDAWQCSSPDINSVKPVTELTSARDVCISILKRDVFCTKDSKPSHQSTTVLPDQNESSPLFECVRCGSMEDPYKMLICDYCEGAFHLSCCNPRVKKIPQEEWYCLVCKGKKPKTRYGKLSHKGELPKNIQRPRRDLSAIQYMLADAEPYETEVRIGRDFQAEVPEWSRPISSNEDHFTEPSELDPREMTMCLQPFKDNTISVGNWIQCHQVDAGVICGKWRRAPLFVVQSSDWDCSCSVVWDPIHADCAVPQELETDEVLKQLKYINKLKKRLDDSNQKK